MCLFHSLTEETWSFSKYIWEISMTQRTNSLQMTSEVRNSCMVKKKSIKVQDRAVDFYITKYSRSLKNVIFVTTLMRCHRNLTLAYINYLW